ncbi:MOSC domain-containing protein [Algoriphagus namhaensis]|uniref:MOSC domain-containing protein n=1 Tax=Algoriphagus namhaensis TaxID=915353 RepID=A0ABV8AQB2_9BACT
MASLLTVQALYIYPIKSLGGISVSEALAQERGFQFDRRWMLVDKGGLFMSQRKHPKMALLQVALTSDGLEVFPKNDPTDRLKIPFEAGTGQYEEVQIWDDEVRAERVGKIYDLWFSNALNDQVTLVKMPEFPSRPVDPRYAHASEEVSFADGMPYLIIGNESLNDLNSKLEELVPMDRFRPNIVFDGGMAFEEDTWEFLEIGEVRFKGVKPCARCILTTVDQETAITSAEPLKTLSSYRKVGNKVLFGQNALALESGKVRVGDSIRKG